MSKLKAFLIMLILVTSMAVFTACSEKIEGTWYLVGEDPDDVDNQLLISDQGTFILDDISGTWSTSDGYLMLMTSWDAETMTESKYESQKCFTDSDGGQWIKDYDKAKEIYDEIVAAEEEQRRLEEEQAQKEREETIEYIVDNVSGRYDFVDYDWAISEDDVVYVMLNDDSTYLISGDNDGERITERGTYSIDVGSLTTNYRGEETLIINLSAEEESSNLAEYKGDDYEDGEASIEDVEACVSYDENGERTIYIEVGNGLGFGGSAYYIPAGTYSKTE